MLCVTKVRLMMCFSITFACISIMLLQMGALMLNSSWLFYSTLRSLCMLHGVDVQNVSRRTLYNWSLSSVAHDHIDLLSLRLLYLGILTPDSLRDIGLSCGFSVDDLFSLSSARSCAASPACRDGSIVATNGDPGVANT